MDFHKKVLLLELFLALLSFCYLLSGIIVLETNRQDCGSGLWGFGIGSWLVMFFTFLGYLARRGINHWSSDVKINLHEYINETRWVVWGVTTVLATLCFWGTIAASTDTCYTGTSVINWAVISLVVEYVALVAWSTKCRHRFCGTEEGLPTYQPRTDWTNYTAPTRYT